jgi:uncharacterized membrane protein
MRFTWQTEVPQWAILAGMFILAAITWGWAPDQIPVHWNLTGEVDRYGGKFEGLLAIPLMALGMYLLLLFLPRIDPGRANYARFAGAYTTFRIAILVLLALVYGIVHLWIRERPVNVGAVMPAIIGGLMVVIGSLLGKIRPNWFVGIRTPWTLSSKMSWTRTHRLGGWLFLLVGLATLVSGAISPRLAFWVLMGGLGVTVVWSFVYSYVVWRGDPVKIPPAGTLPADDT